MPKPVAINVRATITDVVLPLKAAAEAKGVGLELCVPDDARVVVADPTAFRQVLTNLVENAVRHTATGAVTVTASRELPPPTAPVAAPPAAAGSPGCG